MLSRLSTLTVKRSTYQLINKIYSRGLRGVIRPKRTQLERYQKDISKLPPLTQLLTERFESLNLEEALKLREEKLAVYKTYMPVDYNFSLLEALFHADNDIDRLLQIININLESMNSFYVAVSFEVLDDLMRAKLCDVETVIVSPEFKRLCTKTLFKMRFFETDELLKITKCLATVHMPEQSLIAQAVLQMVRHLINDFDRQELIALGQALEEMKVQEDPKKSLLEAIKIAQQFLLKSKFESANAIPNK